MSRRNLFFILFFVLAFLMAYAPIKALYDSASQREYYSHIVLIPLVSIYLIFQKRKLVFSEQENMDGGGARSPRNDRIAGISLLLAGALLYFVGRGVGAAKQCSGIRSSLALLITAILAGHMFLETGWKKVVLAVAIVPITMFKNGIRILILTLMGTYWDPRWLTESSLHRDRGILFFILALVLMAPILY
jgi:exosortase/archaeosortase family protein